MSSDEVARLIALAKEAAAATPDVPAGLALAIQEAAAGPADPWLLAGLLIEGLAHVIGTMPTERRRDCGLAAVVLVAERVRAVGGGGGRGLAK